MIPARPPTDNEASYGYCVAFRVHGKDGALVMLYQEPVRQLRRARQVPELGPRTTQQADQYQQRQKRGCVLPGMFFSILLVIMITKLFNITSLSRIQRNKEF